MTRRQAESLIVDKLGISSQDLAIILGDPSFILDYETYNPGIPFYDGYRPYQHMVFQYSLHVFRDPDSVPEHYEFLMTEQGDPGVRLVEHLAEHIGQRG